MSQENRAAEVFVPAWSYLLVKRDPASEQWGGLILPASDKAKPRTGEILAAGPDVPPEYAVGVRVAFNLYSGHKATILGSADYVWLPAGDVLAWAVNWKGTADDADALNHLEPPPGQLFAERLVDEEGVIVMTDNARTSTRCPVGMVHKVGPRYAGPFQPEDAVVFSQAAVRGFALGSMAERPILAIAPQQCLGWYRGPVEDGKVGHVDFTPDLSDAARELRAAAALDDKFDEGDSRAPR